MAEAAKKPPEQPQKAETEKAVEAKPGAKPDILNVLVVAVVTLNLLAVAGMGVFMKKIWGKIFELQERVEHSTNVEQEEASRQPEKERGIGKEQAPPVQGTLYPMDSFLVNIASDQGPKFLQTQMEFELPDPALEDEITRKKAAIRDAIIVLLSSRTYKQLREANGMVKLRQDILRAINNLLSTGKIREIYFTQFHFN